jgi:hypothetical protein
LQTFFFPIPAKIWAAEFGVGQQGGPGGRFPFVCVKLLAVDISVKVGGNEKLFPQLDVLSQLKLASLWKTNCIL